MKFRNLSLGYKIGIVMAFVPLIVAVLDFFIFCKAGANTGEGCGFLLIVISLPLFWPILFILFPITFITNYFEIGGAWAFHATYTPALMVVYFFVGVLIGKIIMRFKTKNQRV